MNVPSRAAHATLCSHSGWLRLNDVKYVQCSTALT